MKKYKRHRDYGFFDQDIRLSKLTALGDPLHRLIEGVDFEIFRDELEKGLSKLSKGKGGRRPYDYVMMFKILILQRYYNLSDEQVEFQINDRMSFMRFLDLSIADDIPDSRTVWHFREKLTDLGLIEKLFDLFLKELEKLGLIVNKGKIVDASFVEVPKQRNKKQDNDQLKQGKVPEDWKEKPRKLAQKDTDAKWSKKNNKNHFGYKNHVKTDNESKLITKYKVTSANVHDSQVLADLLDEKDKGGALYADSAYTGEEQEKIILKKGLQNKVHEKGYRNKPLTEQQKEKNREKSKIRARVEHVFGFMENSMNGMEIRSIGFKRAEAIVGLSNIVYNMFRKIYLEKVISMG